MADYRTKLSCGPALVSVSGRNNPPAWAHRMHITTRQLACSFMTPADFTNPKMAQKPTEYIIQTLPLLLAGTLHHILHLMILQVLNHCFHKSAQTFLQPINFRNNAMDPSKRFCPLTQDRPVAMGIILQSAFLSSRSNA